MPATVTHIKKSFKEIERLAEEPLNTGIDRRLARAARAAILGTMVDGHVVWQAAWKDLCERAVKLDIAHALPGSVGKKYAALKEKPARAGAIIELDHPQSVIFGSFAGVLLMMDDPPFVVCEDEESGRLLLDVMDPARTAELIIATRGGVVHTEGTREEKHAALFGLDEVLEKVKAITTTEEEMEDGSSGHD